MASSTTESGVAQGCVIRNEKLGVGGGGIRFINTVQGGLRWGGTFDEIWPSVDEI